MWHIAFKQGRSMAESFEGVLGIHWIRSWVGRTEPVWTFSRQLNLSSPACNRNTTFWSSWYVIYTLSCPYYHQNPIWIFLLPQIFHRYTLLNFLHFITRNIFGETHKSWSSSRKFLQITVTYFLLDRLERSPRTSSSIYLGRLCVMLIQNSRQNHSAVKAISFFMFLHWRKLSNRDLRIWVFRDIRSVAGLRFSIFRNENSAFIFKGQRVQKEIDLMYLASKLFSYLVACWHCIHRVLGVFFFC